MKNLLILLLLSIFAASSVHANDERPKKISEMKGVKAQEELYPKFKNYIAYKASGQNCLAYKQQSHPFTNFNAQYRQFLDDKFAEIYTKITNQDFSRLKQKSECLGMNESSFNAMLTRAQNEYDSSPLGVSMKSGMMMVMRDRSSEEQFVDECNVYAYNMNKHFETKAAETFNAGKCEFE